MGKLLVRGGGLSLVFLALVGLRPAPLSGADDAPAPALPESWVKELHWRSIGPANMGGRITDLAVYEKDPNVFWVATASGGLLKTTNDGITFEHQFDHEATVSIGAVAVAPSDPKIVWVGTGEANPRNSVSWGDGVYRSLDGGKTWKNMGLKASFQIGRVVIHPTDPNIVYVGALGRLWGPSEERGLYKTADGGKTWERILYVDDKTGVVDVAMKPDDPEVLLVATYERRRDGFDTNDPMKKWGPGSGLYRTADGGHTWRKLTEGLPGVMLGRIGIDFYRKDPKLAYVIVESEKISQEPENAAYLGVKGEDAEVGARLTEITRESPAEEAKLQVGDIVIRLEEAAVLSYADLLAEVRKHLAGDTVRLEISRDRKMEVVEVTLGKRPGSEEDKETKEPKETKEKKEEPPDQRKVKSGPFGSGLGGQRENAQEQQGPDGREYGGVYRSEDGGLTWRRINSLDPRPMYFSRIRVDPSDNHYLYVLGISLYRSKDGGETFKGDGGSDGIHVDHHALWIDARDGRHMMLGNDGGLYVTRDRMEHWDHLNHMAIGQFYKVAVDGRRGYRVYGGLQDNGSWGGPSRVRHGRGPVNSDWIRVGGGDGFVCAVDREDPDLVYYESQNGAVGRWNLRTGERGFLRPRAPHGKRYRFNWNTPFLLSHHNARIFYSAGNYVFRSLDRGRDIRAISPEISRTDRGSATALAESPKDPDVLYAGTDDGALWRTRNGGHDWENLYELPAAKPEPKEEAKPEPKPKEETKPEEAAKPAPPDPLSGTWEAEAISEMIPEGEGGFSFTMRRTKEGKYAGSLSAEIGEGDLSEIRFDPKTGNVRFRFDSDQMALEFTATIEGTEMKGSIDMGGGMFTMDFEAKRTPPEEGEGEQAPGAAGGTGGKATPAKAKDPDREGFEWKPIRELVPQPRWVNCLVASHHKAGRVYLVFDAHRSDDDEPYVFLSEDFGETWRSIRANLPASAGTTRVLLEDPDHSNLLFLGAEFSAWVSVDRGASWTRLNSNLPTVAVHDFALQRAAGELVAATHGRSLWVLDVSSLRNITPETIRAEAHLYPPQSAVLWRSEPSRGGDGPRRFVGENPPSGASLWYSLGKKARGVRLEVLDGHGERVRELEASREKGLHRVLWDLRRPAPEGGGRGRGRRFRRRGRLVPPGTYRVALTVGGTTYTEDLVVEIDPEHPEGGWLEFEDFDDHSDEEEGIPARRPH